MLFSVIASFGVTFGVLAWIGWRYFALPANTRSPAVRTAEFRVNAMQRSADHVEAMSVHPDPARGFLATLPGALLLAFVLSGLTAAAVLAMSGKISLDPLSAPDLARQEHIQEALKTESLVPPPALPPSVFIGTERLGLEAANRDWRRLDPEFAATVLKVFARLEARGYPFALLEGYRSPARQNALADSGAHVTNARAFQSKHQYGLAVDAAPLRDGRLVISEKDSWAMAAYLALGEEAEKAGLLWGGRWRLMDYGHIEIAGLVGQHRRPN